MEIVMSPGSHAGEIAVDGVQRSYLMHIPGSYRNTHATPIVLVFHGATGSGKRIERVSGFSKLSEKEGFVAVYPDGIDGYWNDGRDPDLKVDDVAFVAALLDHLNQILAVDSDKVYVTGISNGGMMTQRLGLELCDRFAAIASVAGPIPVNIINGSVPQENLLGVLLMHGTDDAFIPYNGGDIEVRLKSKVLSARETAERWAFINGCEDTPETEMLPKELPDDPTEIQKDTYQASVPGGEVVLYTIHNGGHTWPYGNGGSERLLGITSRELDATRVIWEFFEHYTKY